MQIEVRERSGENAITRELGLEIYSSIQPVLARGEPVCLDFAGVKVFASPFLNAAIGQLLKDKSLPTLGGMTLLGAKTLRLVSRMSDGGAVFYFALPARGGGGPDRPPA